MALSADLGAVPKDLSRTLQVIGAGYSRTGTVSFTQALEILLKGPVCHSGSASLLREEAWVKKWISIMSPKPEVDKAFTKDTLKDLLAGYVGVTDNPAVLFVGELAALYPNAKVICTTRDPDRWFESFKDVAETLLPWWLPPLFSILPTVRYFGLWMDGLKQRTEALYSVPPGYFAKDLLEMHNEHVRSVVPADRLHFISLKDGWGPICNILDLPIPDVPMPHANDKLEIQEAFKGLVIKAITRWLQLFAVLAVAVAVGWYYVKQ